MALVTIVKKEGSGPRDVGAKIVVSEEGVVYGTLGGGFFEKHVTEQAVKALREGKPKTIKYSFVGKPVKEAVDTGLICGGVLEVFIDVLRPVPRAIVFGVGKVGKPLADLLNFVGIKVIVADPTPELVTEEMFPYAEARLTGSVEDILKELDKVIKEEDVVFITHGDPETDYVVTKAMLFKPVRYVGLLGSKRKVTEFVKRLVSEGVSPEVITEKLKGPVGADIPADTPEEISVSIIAELLAELKGGSVKSLSIVKDVIGKVTGG